MMERCSTSRGERAAALVAIIALTAFACSGGRDGGAHVTVDLSGDPVRLQSRAVVAEIGRADLHLAFRERGGGEVLTESPDAGGLFYESEGEQRELSAVVSAAEIEDGVRLQVATSSGGTATVSVRFLTERTLEVVLQPPADEALAAVGARWHSPADERIYGLTGRLRDSDPIAPEVIDIPIEDTMPQEVGSLDRRGEMMEMFIRPTLSLYTPFYQSSRGYGLAVEGTMPGRYDLASSDPETLRFRFETGTTSENRKLTFDVFAGPEYDTILEEYTALTGRPLVPPAWTFLNWRWRDVLETGPSADLDGVEVNAQVAEDVKMFEELGIPPGVYLFDRPVLQGNYGFGRFEWDEERLPNTREMLQALRRRGYRILTWSAAWVCGTSAGDNGLEAQQLGFLAPGPAGPTNCADVGGGNFILDVTNAEARSWFGAKLGEFIHREGIDGIKLDRGEEHIPSEVTDVWADGRNGREVHNDYVVLQTKMHYDALADAHPDGDFVLTTRSGYSGTQADSIVWGGDITGSETFGNGPGTDLGLRSAIISQQRAAFMGFPIWGSDTGGYYQFKDRDVFARWIEFSAFSGIMEIGGTGTHAPWDMPTEPHFDTEMIDIYRRYTRLRSSLLDYLVAAAREAGESGLPIVRPMPFLDRGDPELEDRWDQYLFGPDLMVAPVWRIGERSREVYFPAGSWRSLWNESEHFEGPATATVDVPLDVIPVFIRGDAPSPVEAGGI